MSLQTAFQVIRVLIVHGKLSPGAWTVQAEKTERLGMGLPRVSVTAFSSCLLRRHWTPWKIA